MKSIFLILLFADSFLFARIDCEYMNQVQQRVIKKLCVQYNCSCFGIGGAVFDDIDRIFLSFQFDKTYPPMQIRNMIVEMSSIFLNEINTDKRIRPYLRRYPATVFSIRLGLIFPNIEGEISNASISAGRVYAERHGKEQYVYIPVINELYEETFRKVREETDGLGSFRN
ncbi:MAG: hypothetical protein KBC64_07165 [Simkaniaceae bacterium]|nr:hypothetical protein [Simkaniaceae bacterium]